MLDELKNAMQSYQDHSNQTIVEENPDEELTSQPSLTTMHHVVQRGETQQQLIQTTQDAGTIAQSSYTNLHS